MRRAIIRTTLLAAPASACAYVVSDEDRRAKTGAFFSAQFRIANLVRTAALMIGDYSVTLYSNQNANASSEYTRLTEMLKRLQHEQEVTTLEQWKVRGKDKKRHDELEQKIADTRKRMDNTAEALGQLSARIKVDAHDEDANPLSACHQRCANRLRDMCAQNRGCYIKLGQHLAMLDHILPREYNETLTSLLADTPRSSIAAVRRVIKEDLGSYPEDLFVSFSEVPIASASLAQVHVAVTKSGKKVAVKVQHEGLREGSVGDMYAITMLVDLVSRIFEGFSYKWLTREMNINLPLELNFEHEMQNLERAKYNCASLIAAGDLAIPNVHKDLSSKRVLCMDFEDGCFVSDVAKIEAQGLQTSDVARIVSLVFCEQMYRHGFCHCDPHEANVLVRQHPFRKGAPQVVLLDHGLYRQLNDSFRRDYCRLWRALVEGDEKEIKLRCDRLHVGSAFTLLAAMLTMRPWDDITSGDVNRLKGKGTAGESEMLKAYAKRYFKDIVALLGRVDSEMLLLLKTNDCLRHLDKALGRPVNTALIVAEVTNSVIVSEDLDGLSIRNNLGEVIRVLSKWFTVRMRQAALQVISWCISWSRFSSLN